MIIRDQLQGMHAFQWIGCNVLDRLTNDEIGKKLTNRQPEKISLTYACAFVKRSNTHDNSP